MKKKKTNESSSNQKFDTWARKEGYTIAKVNDVYISLSTQQVFSAWCAARKELKNERSI